MTYKNTALFASLALFLALFARESTAGRARPSGRKQRSNPPRRTPAPTPLARKQLNLAPGHGHVNGEALLGLTLHQLGKALLNRNRIKSDPTEARTITTGASARTRRQFRKVPRVTPFGPFEEISSGSLGGGAFVGTLNGRQVVVKPLVATRDGDVMKGDPREHYWIHKEALDMGAVSVIGLTEVIYFPAANSPTQRKAFVMPVTAVRPPGGRRVTALVQTYEPNLLRQDTWDTAGLSEVNVIEIVRQMRRIGQHWTDVITNPFLARNTDGSFRVVFLDIDPDHWHSTPNNQTLENIDDTIRFVAIPLWFGLQPDAAERVEKAVYGTP